MALRQTEIERIRQRAEGTARRELGHHDRRERTTVDDPDTNRRMMLKKRLKWRSKFNVLGLFFISGLISIFTLFIDAGTGENATPSVSARDIQQSQPGPVFLRNEMSKRVH